MGQNSSTMGNTTGGTAASPRNKSKPPRPSQPPQIPKIPNYVVPENKVIPNGVGDMENARKLLRPVSQELTKFHPEFADIFQYDPEMDFLNGLAGSDDNDSSLERSSLNNNNNNNNNNNKNNDNREKTGDKENSKPGLNNQSVNYTPDPYAKTNTTTTNANGSIPNGKAATSPILNNNNNSHSNSVGDLLLDNTITNNNKSVKESNLKRTHSLGERDRSSSSSSSNTPRIVGGHKRQASLTTNGLAPSPPTPAIPEDPREHLYNVTRHQPFSNLIPANASLPLKSSFESDYSLNLTYAQLAEYRRQQRNEDFESKTGQKLKDLGHEINATNIIPKSPFDRANLGAKSKLGSTHSVSTGSSEAGVSKSKKKKAAPPPPPPPPEKEPPADYDMQDVSIDTSAASSQQRKNSSALGNLRTTPIPPTPLSEAAALHTNAAKRMSVPTVSRVERNQIAAARSVAAGNASKDSLLAQQQQQVAPAPPPPPPPPPLAPPSLPSAGGSAKETTNIEKSDTPVPQVNNDKNKTPGQSSLNKSMSDAKAQLEMLKQMAATLKSPKPELSTGNKNNNNNNNNETKNESSADANSSKENVAENVTPVTTQNLPDANNNPTNKKDILNNVPNVTSNNGSAIEQPENFDIPVVAAGKTPFPSSSCGETEDSPRSQVKRMNSLLQHDIILAATAQGAKQKKTRQPQTYVKPKDAAQVFREELQKAAQAREERRSKEVQQKDPPQPSIDSNSNNEVPGDFEDKDNNVVLRTNHRQRQRVPASNNYSNETTHAQWTTNNYNNQNNNVNDRSLSKLVSDLTPIGGQNGLLSTRSSASFENMSISSNNSQRIYSSNWTPEEDLEPDDDILRERNTNDKRRPSSQGFKSSIVPMKIRDLKDGKEKNHHPKSSSNSRYEKQAANRKETTDAATTAPGADDSKNKIGSIRRFKKTVRENVKNAFGSISKASGKILKRNKSQDFLSKAPENSNSNSLRPVSSSSVAQADLDTSDNWELLRDGESSLRRSRSADFLQNSSYFEDADDSDEENSQSDHEIDDIDFASGIDDQPKTTTRNNNVSFSDGNPAAGASPMRQMKRAGVAYVSGTGQIIVLPEYNTVTVDSQGNEVRKAKPKAGGDINNFDDDDDDDDDDSRAPKLFRKKDKKKLKYKSTVRVQERHRRDEIITREIREKENQIERERLRQQEIERDFRRLRDLDTQERLQRMQTDSILQQLTFLQQQQVRQAHMDLNNGDVVPPAALHQTPPGGTHPPLPNHNFTSNQHNSLIPVVSNLPPQHQNYTTHFPGGPPPPSHQNHQQQHHSINNTNTTTSSIIPNGYLNHQHQQNPPSSQIPKISPSSINHLPSHFPPTHNSHLMNGVSSSSSTPNTNNISNNANYSNIIPNLSAHDLNYLSGYMKMMGVAPPANQQQWAFLLSSVSFNTPPFPASNINTPTTHNNTTNGPDLSQLFGLGKTLESTVLDNTASKEPPSFYELVHKNSNSNNVQTNVILSQFPSLPLPENASSKLIEVSSDSLTVSNALTTVNNVHQQNTTTSSPNSNNRPSSSSFHNSSKISSPEERLDALALTGNGNNNDFLEEDNSTAQSKSSSSLSKTAKFQDGAHDDVKLTSDPVSPRLPSKVYGPLGFRPVSFKAGAT